MLRIFLSRRVFLCVVFGFQFLLLPFYTILHYQFVLCTQRNERIKYLIFFSQIVGREHLSNVKMFFEWPALRDNSGARIEIKWIFFIDEKKKKHFNKNIIVWMTTASHWFIHFLCFIFFLFIFEFITKVVLAIMYSGAHKRAHHHLLDQTDIHICINFHLRLISILISYSVLPFLSKHVHSLSIPLGMISREIFHDNKVTYIFWQLSVFNHFEIPMTAHKKCD